MIPQERIENPFSEYVDLVAERVGGEALAANDEFFAGKENLLKPGRGVFIPDKFTEFGKWMDGWETRRRRTPGYDWCVLKLGMPGIIRGVDVDTNHFLGNFPEFCSLEVTRVAGNPSTETLLSAATVWTPLVPKSPLRGGSQNFFKVEKADIATHVRLNIFPDGGVARLRLYGTVTPDWESLLKSGEPVDLAGMVNGGTVITCNDNFFGPKDNLILPKRAANMGEGWETRRKRVSGHDWIVVKLGRPAVVTKVEVDTNHYKGNYPDRCSLEGIFVEGDISANGWTSADLKWSPLLPETKLQPHHRHFFEKEILNAGRVSHVRLNIFPDGGISRLRVYGRMK